MTEHSRFRLAIEISEASLTYLTQMERDADSITTMTGKTRIVLCFYTHP